ncbi:axoneme-associated protein mst101(2)-like [Ranitomeya imitator]|uniref:axoneme-associated protein mst101(2)-like n=1 Tax=Ranitomeya imitator TaxID=111125 RepID=UPI0037E93BAC
MRLLSAPYRHWYSGQQGALQALPLPLCALSCYMGSFLRKEAATAEERGCDTAEERGCDTAEERSCDSGGERLRHGRGERLRHSGGKKLRQRRREAATRQRREAATQRRKEAATAEERDCDSGGERLRQRRRETATRQRRETATQRRREAATAEERGCDTAEERGCDTAEERGCDTAEERGCDTAEERGCDSGGERLRHSEKRGCDNQCQRKEAATQQRRETATQQRREAATISARGKRLRQRRREAATQQRRCGVRSLEQHSPQGQDMSRFLVFVVVSLALGHDGCSAGVDIARLPDVDFADSHFPVKRTSYQLIRSTDALSFSDHPNVCYFIQNGGEDGQISCRLRLARSKFNFNPFGLRFGKRQQKDATKRRDASSYIIPYLLQLKNGLLPPCRPAPPQRC